MRDKPIKVLYVVTHGEMGGVHRFIESVVFHHGSRFRALVLSFRDGPWLTELRNRGMTVYCLDNARLREVARCFSEVRRIVVDEGVDIVHSSYPWCHCLVAPAAIWSRCKLVWSHHGPISKTSWQGLMSMVPAHLLLTNSNFMLSRLERTWFWARHTGVVHYGIEAQQFAPDEQRRRRQRSVWRLEDDTVAVGIIGFLDTWKGQDIFLRAATLLRSSGLRLRMFVVGGPRDGLVEDRCRRYERELHEYAEAKGLGKIVSFAGHVDVREGALDSLDIFVHASTEPEPLGSVILEAMANRKAIIACAEGGPCELLSDGTDGLLIEPRSPEKLAQAIQRLCENPEERTALGTAALNKVTRELSPEIAARKLEDWYERLLS
jgi:glycosyltransferase involved in cell wall biosynthesis